MQKIILFHELIIIIIIIIISSKRLLLPLIGYYSIINKVSIVFMSKENKVNHYKKMN